jgi:hypothetical protein
MFVLRWRRVLTLLAGVTIWLFANVAVTNAQGFKGEYYRDAVAAPLLPDSLAFVRVDPDIAFTDTAEPGTQPWNLASGIGALGNFTVRWTATLRVTVPGDYQFILRTDSDGILTVDGTTLVDQRGAHPRSNFSGSKFLSADAHFIEVYYAKAFEDSVIKLTFQPPGATQPSSIPPSLLTPAAPFGPNARMINFDNIPAGTFLDQLSLIDGVLFASVAGAGAGYQSRPRVVSGVLSTTSQPNILINDSFDAVDRVHDAGSANVPLTIVFRQPQLRVSVFTGTEVVPRVVVNPVLRAYNAEGQLVGADLATSVTPSISSRLEVGRAVPDIASVSIDFGSVDSGERIDDLRIETSDSVPPPNPDVTPPVINIDTPLEGALLFQSPVTVTGTVREESGLLDSVSLDGGAVALLPPADLSCVPPLCRRFTGTVLLSDGQHVLNVRARDHAGNVSLRSVNVTLVTHTRVHVADEQGAGVSGAQVYAAGVFRGLTDAAGRLDISPPLFPGTPLVARRLIVESPTDRGAHNLGSTRNWKYRVYVTSLTINNDGSALPQLSLASLLAVNELTLLRSNVLIGFNLVASIEWDASQTEVEVFRERLIKASEYMFNATDGQFLIEQVSLVDNAALWEEADLRIYASLKLWAHVDCPRGGIFGDSLFCDGSRIHVQRRGNDADINDQGDNFSVYVHEFGHYGFELGDEYSNIVDCTRSLSVTGPYHQDEARASCIMFNSHHAAKLCSDHPDNPHVACLPGSFPCFPATAQGVQSCWDHVVERYADPSHGQPRWVLKTPTSRGVIVGEINGGLLPVRDFRTRVEVTNQTRPALCREFPVTFLASGGRPLRGLAVSNFTTYGQRVVQGETEPDGSIEITGAHVGDQIRATLGFQSFGPFGITEILSSAFRVRPDDCEPALFSLRDRPTNIPRGRSVIVAPAPIPLSISIELAGKDQCLIRVRSSVRLKGAPELSFELVGKTYAQAIKLKFDQASRSYLGLLTNLNVDTEGVILVTAHGARGVEVTRVEAVSFSATDPRVDTEVFSTDGQLALTIPHGSMRPGSRIVTGPVEVSLPAIASDYAVLGGPFTVKGEGGLNQPATLELRLAPQSLSSKVDLDSLVIFKFNPHTSKWENAGGFILHEHYAAIIQITDFGSFFLAGRQKPVSVSSGASVAVDVKPGICPNPLSSRETGVIPVAILGSRDFDVNYIDTNSVLVEGVRPVRFLVQDVAAPSVPTTNKVTATDCTSEKRDGFRDLVVYVDAARLRGALKPLVSGTVSRVRISARLMPYFGGGSISGEDLVLIIK